MTGPPGSGRPSMTAIDVFTGPSRHIQRPFRSAVSFGCTMPAELRNARGRLDRVSHYPEVSQLSPAVTPPPTRRRSPLWYVTVLSLVVVGLLGVFGALHWYAGYARGLGPTVTVPRVLDKTGAAEKKAEKPSVHDSTGAKAGAGDQADTSETVGSHKSNAKPTMTPGA